MGSPAINPYAKPGPYVTALAPDQEQKFQGWVKQNNVPWQDTPTADYDMRGYWKDNVAGSGGVKTKVSAFDNKPHYPDTYKTPYHASFSNESEYATKDAPHWVGDKLVDKDGQTVVDETPKGKSMADPQQNPAGLSAQDLQDIEAIRRQLPTDDPRHAKIDTLMMEYKQGGNVHAASAPEAAAEDHSFLHGVTEGAKGLGHAIMHPLDTMGAMGKNSSLADPIGGIQPITGNLPEANRKAYEDVRDENYQGANNQVSDILHHPLEAAGEAVPGLAMAAATHGIMKAVPAMRGFVPTSSADIVSPAETAATRLAKSVLPAGKDASNFIRAAQQEVPNVLDYAKRTNNPLNTQAEFSKAAEGHAGDVRDFYENQVLGPNDKIVKTGTDFGKTQGEGPAKYATLSDIDKRITNINEQLDKPALNSDDARRALSSKTDLQAEAAQLRKVLHENLANATGMSPEDIADIRQRAGRSYELANDTKAANLQRVLDEGKNSLKPVSWGDIPGKLLNAARGGPTAIADRSFQKAIKGFPGDSRPLPTLNPPALEPAPPQRPPVWAGMSPAGHPDIQPLLPDVQGARGQMLGKVLQRSKGEQPSLFAEPSPEPPPPDMGPVKAANKRLMEFLWKSKTPLSPNQPPRYGGQ